MSVFAAGASLQRLSEQQACRCAAKAIARCRELAAVTDVPGETTRTFLSPAMFQANAIVGRWMQDAGLETWIDSAGNLRGRKVSTRSDAKTFLIGSHLDTVRNAGAFDGVLGVVIGIELAALTRHNELPFHLEVAGFSEEEGVRFGAPFLGSLGLTGRLDGERMSLLDGAGVSVAEALNAAKLKEAPNAAMTGCLGYLEVHIEQGPVLELHHLPLGVVETIAGQSRFQIVFTGQTNHAGTTPMHLRKDAMVAAAAWIVEVERYARSVAGLVATTGQIGAHPNAGNCVAGEVKVSLDVRAASDGLRELAVGRLLILAREAADARGVTLSWHQNLRQCAVSMDKKLTNLLADAVASTGRSVYRMTSGAGHDAMIVASAMPAAMLFVRSPGGVSHHPDESVHEADVALAFRAGESLLNALAFRERPR